MAAPAEHHPCAQRSNTETICMTTDSVKVLLRKFLAPEGDSPNQIKDRLLQLRDTIRDPKQFTDDHHPEALKKAQRNARQNLRRLIARNAVVAAQIMRE